MQNQDKKSDKKKSKGGLIAVIVLLVIIESLGSAAGVAVAGIAVVCLILFCIIVFIAATIGALKKKGKADLTGKKTEKKAKNFTKPQSEVKPEKQERKYYDSDCEMMSSDHDHDRRTEQLKGFLKNGIISLKEYNILIEKYTR